MTYRDELSKVTLEVYERYAVEVVERFGFCPWARSSRTSGQVVLRVVFSTDLDDFGESLGLLSELQEQPPGTDIALFIYPLCDLGRLAFEDFARRLRTRAEQGSQKLDAYALAAFHPSATADLSHPDKLVPFVRRSPDPTLQLVRKSALSAIKGLASGTAFFDVSQLSIDALTTLEESPKAVRERIAEQNLETVHEVGPGAVEAVLADIARQREQAHQALFARHGQRGPERIDPG